MFLSNSSHKLKTCVFSLTGHINMQKHSDKNLIQFNFYEECDENVSIDEQIEYLQSIKIEYENLIKYDEDYENYLNMIKNKIDELKSKKFFISN